jgi:hypothetical protein
VALPGLAKATVIASMSTKSRQVIFGSRIRGAKIRAEGAREEAAKVIRAADRAEAKAWSISEDKNDGSEHELDAQRSSSAPNDFA